MKKMYFSEIRFSIRIRTDVAGSFQPTRLCYSVASVVVVCLWRYVLWLNGVS